MKKHPASFRLTDAALDARRAAAEAEGGGAGEVLLYDGPVRGLCPLAPSNVNTMACAALAGHTLGFDGTVGRLVADARLETHEIEASSSRFERARRARRARRAARRPLNSPPPLSPSFVRAQVVALGPVRPDGSRFRCALQRSSPAPVGAVTSTATYASFLNSLLGCGGRGPGVHFV